MRHIPRRISQIVCMYRIAGTFRGVIFSWFSWSRGEPQNIYPRKTARATGLSGDEVRPARSKRQVDSSHINEKH